MIFGEEARDAARRNLAPGDPATPGEAMRSAFDEGMETRRSISAYSAMRRTYARYLDEVRAVTGESFENPMDSMDWRGDFATPSAHARAREREEKALSDKLLKLRERHPEMPWRSPEEIRNEIAAERSALRERRADVARREVGFAAGAASFVGSAGAVLLDPPVAASMAFGLPFSTGILRGALVDAGVGAASETFAQGVVQTERQAFGEKTDFKEAAESVAFAAGGTGAFSLGLRALVKGARALRNPSPEVRDAAAVVERRADMEETSPYRERTPEATADHLERLDDALNAARTGSAPSEARPATRAAKPRATPTAGALVADALPDDADLARMGADLARAVDLRESFRATVTDLADRSPEDFAALVQQVRRPPKVDEISLLGFLQKEGIQDQAGELASIGITSRARPGLLRATGRTLDQAAEAAYEAGYFGPPSEVARPSIPEFLDAVAEDFAGAGVFVNPEARAIREQAETLGRLGSELSDAGIDLDRLNPAEAHAVVKRLAADVRHEFGGDAVPISRAEGDFVRMTESDAARFDRMLEADVRRDFKGRESETIWLENDDGTTARMTIAEMLADIEADDALLKHFGRCLA